MRILIVTTLYGSFGIGGAPISVQNLAEALTGCGHEVLVVSLHPGHEVKIEFLNGVQVIYVPLLNFYWPYNTKPSVIARLAWHILDQYNVFYKKQFLDIFKKFQPNIIHTNNLRGFSIYIWRLAAVLEMPIVHTLRDYYLENPSHSLAIIKRKMSKHVRHVVGVSHFILEEHVKNGYFSQTMSRSVIYNSFEPTLDTVTQKTEIAKPLTVGFIGRIVPSKGLDILLRCISSLNNKDINILVAGKGEEHYEKRLQGEFATENIHFLGQVSPNSFYQNLDLLVVPSVWDEPLGRVVIESYAFGVPVLASNRGGLPELVDEGATGFLFDPSNEERLILLLQRFIDNPGLALAMREACFNKSKQFRHKVIANNYLHIYKAALNSNNA